MINHAAIALTRLTRMRALMRDPILPAVPTPSAPQAAASDGLTLSPRPSIHPRRSAVEAGRSAKQSDRGASPMDTDYISRQYGVPVSIGGRIRYTGDAQPQLGTIVSVEGARLRIKLDGQAHVGLFHPTWEIEYLEGAAA